MIINHSYFGIQELVISIHSARKTDISQLFVLYVRFQSFKSLIDGGIRFFGYVVGTRMYQEKISWLSCFVLNIISGLIDFRGYMFYFTRYSVIGNNISWINSFG